MFLSRQLELAQAFDGVLACLTPEDMGRGHDAPEAVYSLDDGLPELIGGSYFVLFARAGC